MAASGVVGFPALLVALKAFYETGTWKCMLLNNSYTPDSDNHDYINDASANEISIPNYSAGGITITPTVTFNGTTNLFTITFPQAVVNSTTGTAYYAAYYQDTGTPSTSRIAYVNDFGQAITATNGSLTANACTITFDFPD